MHMATGCGLDIGSRSLTYAAAYYICNLDTAPAAGARSIKKLSSGLEERLNTTNPHNVVNWATVLSLVV